jgi:hypothetical protein
MQDTNSKFIIPLILEGDFETMYHIKWMINQ